MLLFKKKNYIFVKKMQASFKEIDEIYNFEGLWGRPSKCGLKILQKEDKYTVIVSELYKENPGTSVTQASCLLAKQICNDFQIPQNELLYIEHNPSMNSKLSFYDEEFFIVSFDISGSDFTNPKWEKITEEKLRLIYK